MTLSLVQSSRDTLILHVKDNGIGFDVEAVHRANISIGMRSMSTRMARVGEGSSLRQNRVKRS